MSFMNKAKKGVRTVIKDIIKLNDGKTFSLRAETCRSAETFQSRRKTSLDGSLFLRCQYSDFLISPFL